MCAVQMPTVKVEALWLRLFVCRIINDLPLILHKCQGQADRKQTGRTLTFGIGQAGSRSRSLLSASRQTEVNNQYHLITLITLFCAALLFSIPIFFLRLCSGLILYRTAIPISKCFRHWRHGRMSRR